MQHGPYETVEDLMTKKSVITCHADTSIDEGVCRFVIDFKSQRNNLAYDQSVYGMQLWSFLSQIRSQACL